jgi:hypothetical protein
MKKPKAPTKLDDIVISSTDASMLIGKSRNWVAKLVADGFVKKTGSLFKPADVTLGYLKFLADDERRHSKTATLSQVQAARAREIEMRIAREENKLIDLDEALGVLDEIVGGMKSDFDGLAAAVTRDATLRTIIEEKVDAIYKRHADALVQKANSLRSCGASIEADSEDDA